MLIKTNPQQDNTVYGYFSEQVSAVDDQKDWNFKVHHNKDLDILYVVFDATLQSFGVMNRNRRSYVADNIMHHVNTDPVVTYKISHNKFSGELGHPQPKVKGEELAIERLVDIPKERSSHVMHNLHLEGNLLRARVKTDPGTQNFGVNVAKSIIGAGYVPAFSLRSFGKLQQVAGKPVVQVSKLITYDLVEYPSHIEAESDIKIKKFNESSTQIVWFPELVKYASSSASQKMLMESFNISQDELIGLTESGSHMIARQQNDTLFVPTNSADEIRNHMVDILKGGH